MRKWFNWQFVFVGCAAAVLALVTASATAGAAPNLVNGAAFTTTNPAIDNPSGTTTLCLNGNPGPTGPNHVPAINCNIYTDKSFVWLSGGPGSSHLSDGSYFFAVLVPGGQPNPNDGGAKNLSDETCAPYSCPANNGDLSAIPSGDAYGNRTFSITNGTISYGGTHDPGNNEIRLMPYDDTTDNGGVYIMAICSLASGYPVDPANCKYDAFKVQESSVLNPPAADLVVTKDATPSFTRTFGWTIEKSVDQPEADIAAGGTATFNYTVSVTHDSETDSAWEVTGTITVLNPNSVAFANVNLTDAVDNGATCSVLGGVGATVPALTALDFAYVCSYGSAPSPAAGTNTATASWNATTYHTPNSSADFTVPFAFGDPTTIVDGSITVTDNLGGDLGTASYTDSSPRTFTYPILFPGDPAGTCTTHHNTATFTTDTTSTTDSANKSVKVCVGADLTVSKTATTSFTRTFGWGISKSVDKTSVKQSGTSATFNYTVSVTHDAGTDSKFAVGGSITVTNPNDWEAITANIGDAIDNGGNCTVSDGSNVSVPASGSVTATYVCTFASNPGSGTNTGGATWDKTAASTPHGSAAGTAAYAFGAPTTIADGSVTVTDTLGGSLGSVSYTDPSPTTFTYSHVVTGTPGTCVTQDNTATFTTNTTHTTGSDSKTVQLCVGADLTVAKTASPSYTRTYNWRIAKSVDKTLLDAGGTATYTVVATEQGFTDSNFAVNGTITVSNPNDWEAITLNGIGDTIDKSGVCTVTLPGNLSIAAKGSVSAAYVCTFGANPLSGINTGSATWSAATAFTPDGSAGGTANYTFGNPTSFVNQSITVTDTILATTTTLGTAGATDATPFTVKTFTYSHHFNPPSTGCVTINNTANIVGTSLAAVASVRVCNTGALTMGFWQNKNGQAIIKSGTSTGGVCNSGTWLRQFASFQDLSATATCSQVAAYFAGVFNVANAGGASMNPMLKAQMLATALDVYFSDGALGGNQIGATVPIGGVTIDLTKIYGSENVSAAFGGATSMTVLQMLNYAATQSNVGGSIWYVSNNKVIQGLAKDAFDSINNQTAVSP